MCNSQMRHPWKTNEGACENCMGVFIQNTIEQKKKHPQEYKQECQVMHKEWEHKHRFQTLLSGGLLSYGVNHYLSMNTSNWVRAFVFGCGSESKATGETVLAFVMCLWTKKTLLWRLYMWEASNTMGYIYKVKAKLMLWTRMFWAHV